MGRGARRRQQELEARREGEAWFGGLLVALFDELVAPRQMLSEESADRWRVVFRMLARKPNPEALAFVARCVRVWGRVADLPSVQTPAGEISHPSALLHVVEKVRPREVAGMVEVLAAMYFAAVEPSVRQSIILDFLELVRGRVEEQPGGRELMELLISAAADAPS